jgi:hypothetical protein
MRNCAGDRKLPGRVVKECRPGAEVDEVVLAALAASSWPSGTPVAVDCRAGAAG